MKTKKLSKELMAYFNKNTKRSLDKQLLKIWQEVVKLRANYICEFPMCRKSENLNAHHIITRSNYGLRYDTSNGICLCSGHHTMLTCSAHKNPFFKDVLIEAGVRSKEFFEKLKLSASYYYKPDKKLILIALNQELNKLKNEELLKPYKTTPRI